MGFLEIRGEKWDFENFQIRDYLELEIEKTCGRISFYSPRSVHFRGLLIWRRRLGGYQIKMFLQKNRRYKMMKPGEIPESPLKKRFFFENLRN